VSSTFLHGWIYAGSIVTLETQFLKGRIRPMSRPKAKVPQSVQKAFGERVRQLRTKNGWPSPEDFAEACGISPKRLRQVEDGETKLTLSKIVIIAKNLKTTVSELFEGVM
jgi:ribosome-binding protein aMBF1 (putative translation factor)